MKCRAFLAVDVAEELKMRIGEIQDILKSADAHVKYVEQGNLHFTLKFFGDVGRRKIQRISDIVERTAGDYEPFTMDIKGLGVFPNMNYIRVIWLGVKNPEIFSNLQETLDREFKKIGFKLERDYVPHLTIGRVKGPRNKDKLIELLSNMEDVEVGPMTVRELRLKKSELTPSGPLYSDIKVFKL